MAKSSEALMILADALRMPSIFDTLASAASTEERHFCPSSAHVVAFVHEMRIDEIFRSLSIADA
jgi:hypothetical protein